MTDLEHCPRPQPLDYTTINADEVVRVFQDYQNSRDRYLETKTQGQLVSTYYQPGDISKLSQTTIPEPWHRTTSFSNEQLEYIYYINKTINTLILGRDPNSPLSLAERIATNLETIDDYYPISNQAVLSIITDICTLYPKLTPALYSFLVKSDAGSHGISLATLHARRGMTREEAQKLYHIFIGINADPSKSTRNLPFEVICKGVPVALHIIDQFRTADELHKGLHQMTLEQRQEANIYKRNDLFAFDLDTSIIHEVTKSYTEYLNLR